MSTVLSKPGTLYIVATPIGNLADITDRAKQVLSQVDLIAAEDTRHSGQLLHLLGLNKPQISLHEFNEQGQSQVIINKLIQGDDVALISDAGTPLVSDPGYRLLDLSHQNQITVVPVPGASAVMTALCACGISTADYRFVGFLPAKAKQRRAKLAKLAEASSTLVLFESPHRILATLKDCEEMLGAQRLACYCRELTKKFETIYRAKLADILRFVEADANQQRGEIVLVIAGNSAIAGPIQNLDDRSLLQSLLQYMSIKDAATILAKATGKSRKYFYQMGLIYKND